MYCVTIYNENLRKLNGDESLRITSVFHGTERNGSSIIHGTEVENVAKL